MPQNQARGKNGPVHVDGPGENEGYVSGGAAKPRRGDVRETRQSPERPLRVGREVRDKMLSFPRGNGIHTGRE